MNIVEHVCAEIIIHEYCFFSLPVSTHSTYNVIHTQRVKSSFMYLPILIAYILGIAKKVSSTDCMYCV